MNRIDSSWVPRTLADVRDFLRHDLHQAPRALFRGGEGFESAAAFLSQLGDPQDSTQAIHIAGTAGKGSVAYALSSILGSMGLSVGLHVSPDVYDLRERFQVDGCLASPEDTVALLQRVLVAIRKMRSYGMATPTFFEVTVAMAFAHFAKAKCDIAVVETGLGGLFDATNTITRHDKLAVITRIGFDHESVLGTTLGEIARQKAGILPLGGEAVVLAHYDDAVDEVIRDIARERGCTLHWVEPIYTTDEPKHLSENLAIVSVCLEVLARRARIPNGIAPKALDGVAIPGRFERLEISGGIIVLDGAHNALKIEALLERLDNTYPGQPARWVFGCRKDKRQSDLLSHLAARHEPVCLVEFEITNGDVPADVSTSVDYLLSIARDLNMQVFPARDLYSAARFLLNKPRGELGVATGSFHLLSQLRPVLATAGLVI